MHSLSLCHCVQVLYAVDAEVSCALTVCLPACIAPSEFQGDPLQPDAQWGDSDSADPLTPSSLFSVHSSLSPRQSVEDAVGTLFPRLQVQKMAKGNAQLPLFIFSRKTMSWLGDAAVVLFSRVVPFLAELQTQV
jgi:hypothetical protein